MNQPYFKIFFMAIRPKTLIASIAPVFIGTSMAIGDGIEHIPTAIGCLLAALAIQIATNLTNDYFDFKNGADTSQRLGPTRVMQAGLISPTVMRMAILLTFGLAILACYYLVKRGGWPIAVIGVLAVLSGFFYTAGRRPLGYLGLGDLFVFIFFGPVAVAGTYYVQSLEINTAVILAGFAPGFLSVGILTINNLRDILSDAKSNKLTLAVRFGRGFALSEYLFSILAASLMPVVIYYVIQDHEDILISTIISILAIPTLKTVLTKIDGPSLNKALESTGKLLLVYSILFSIGWVSFLHIFQYVRLVFKKI